MKYSIKNNRSWLNLNKPKLVPNWCIYMQIEGCSYNKERDLIRIKTLAMTEDFDAFLQLILKNDNTTKIKSLHGIWWKQCQINKAKQGYLY